jgi:TonB family protein
MANYTILLIDYEPRSIERFREPLVAAGYAIEIATDGVSGIEAFHRLNPDMVLVEAMIPKKHGFEVCQELKRTPHGRQTPVLITTGVYKGRKYRTQALHIYGCDEYIEKPIAPEQLLKIVGKFFGSAASAPAPKAAEPALAPPDDEADPSDRGPRGAVPLSVSSTETSAQETPESQGTRLTSVRQHSVVKDGAEDEIIARLDAILPGGGNTTQRFSERETVSAVVEIAETDEDPFAQMRAELNAELGSLSAALAFEPTLAPSDQVPAPSVLEALPTPDAEIRIAPNVPSVPPPSIVGDTGSGQVVDFVAKRGRKNKKSRQQDAARSPKPARITPAPEPVELTLPRNTIVASELDPSARRSGMPAWIWAALGAVAIATIYFVFGRSGSSGSDAEASRPKPAAVAVAPAESKEPSEVTVPPVANDPLHSASAVVEPPPQRVPESSKPMPGALAVPAPKKETDRAAKVPVATIPAPKPPVVAPESGAIAKSRPAKIAPKIDAAKETRPEATAPPTLEDTVAGVEAVPEPSPTTTIEPGTLIPIDTADTMPVALSHRVPVYSLQARQMTLSGTVVMNVLVNERGTVDQVVLVTGVSGAGVNEAAMQAAESWTYRPATKNGVPVKVWKSEQVIFKL